MSQKGAEVSNLVERLRANVGSTPDSMGVRTVWLRNPDGPEAADRIEKLERALRTIASNDESSIDGDGNPMPIRPQWSRQQCSSIARLALEE